MRAPFSERMCSWAVLHVPLFLVFFHSQIAATMRAATGPLGLAWACSFVAQGAFLALLMFLLTIPALVLGRRYATLAPALGALFVAWALLDSLVSCAMGFHINGLVARVACQPGVLHELGLSVRQVALLGGLLVALVAGDTLAGRWFILRAVPRSAPWRMLALLVLICGVDRLGVGVLTFYAGDTAQVVGATLPLQLPLRMGRVLSRWTNRPEGVPVFEGSVPSAAPAATLDAGDVHFTRRPDVVYLLVESLPASFLSEATMPRLWRRSHDGAVFQRHYAAASSTHYSLFSLLFGLDANRLERTLGRGDTPLIFRALRANGYRAKLYAASSVSWFGLDTTVLRDVQGALESDFEGPGNVRDDAMLARARQTIASTPATEPLFLFMFFDGTHFDYSFTRADPPLLPQWDPSSTTVLDASPQELRNRARQAAFDVDRKVDELLTFFEAHRGRPLVLLTGDHGEEFREHGRVGHGSDVTDQQVHVPMVLWDEGLTPGVFSHVTGHVDVLPTLMGRLGAAQAPTAFGDGRSLFDASADRFVLTTVGWEPRCAVIGSDLKVEFFGLDAGLGPTRLLDPDDRPVSDGPARLARSGVSIVRALRGRP